VSVDRLTNARTILTDEAIAQLGRSVTETLTKMRGCASNVGQVQPHRTLGDDAAEIPGGGSRDPHHHSESDLISASLTDLMVRVFNRHPPGGPRLLRRAVRGQKKEGPGSRHRGLN